MTTVFLIKNTMNYAAATIITFITRQIKIVFVLEAILIIIKIII